jgi:hypothetical protein
VRGQVPGKLLLGHALTVGGYGAALRTMTDGSLGRHLSRRIDESGQSLTPPATTYSVFTADRSIAREGHSKPLHSATDISRHVGS